MSIDANNIHSKAMLIYLSLPVWTARRLDKKISRQAEEDHHVEAGTVMSWKFLLPGDCATYKAVVQSAGSLRTWHYANTLPWLDTGYRLLPSANYQPYMGEYRTRRVKHVQLCEDFLIEYPDFYQSAPTRLNGLYKPEDWPSPSSLRHKFGCYVDTMPLALHGDFRLDGLSDSEVADLDKDKLERVSTALEAAVKEAWERLYKCVAHIQERLSQPDAIFRDSLITNAAELCDVLERLNVTQDSNLESMRLEVAEYIALQDPDTIRENSSVRSDVAELAEDIISRMGAFYQPDSEAE